jgi:hypothetical protein
MTYILCFQSFLPLVESEEQLDLALSDLFESKNIFFGNPADKFKSDLFAGKLGPESASTHRVAWRAEKRNYDARMKERAYTMLEEILQSRKTLLESASTLPTRTPLCVVKMERKSVAAAVGDSHTVGQRYCREMAMIESECPKGLHDEDDEEEEEDNDKDEFYPDGPPPKKHSKRVINLLESDYFKSLTQDNATKPAAAVMPAAVAVPAATKKAKRQSLLPPLPPTTSSALPPLPPPALPVSPTSLNQLSMSLLQPNSSPPKSLFQSPPRSADLDIKPPLPLLAEQVKSEPEPEPSKSKSVNDQQVVEDAVANIPGMESSDVMMDFSAAEAPLLGVVKEEEVKVEAEEEEAKAKPSLQALNPQPTSYFCLLRDKFIAKPDFKITIPNLEEEIFAWQETDGNESVWNDNPNCAWVNWVVSWKEQIPSAVAFLTGAFPGN